jgi:prepilin-type N-terminal cleavage/methylation domain-containing protein
LAPGFTLLETIIVIAIMALIAAMGLGLAFSMGDGGETPRESLIYMARTASRAAIVQGRPVQITFSKNSFGISGGASGDGSGKAMSCTVPKGTTISVQRWNQGVKWSPVEGLTWTFFPTGISDALHFRFDDDGGRSIVRFNPLTGTPRPD